MRDCVAFWLFLSSVLVGCGERAKQPVAVKTDAPLLNNIQPTPSAVEPPHPLPPILPKFQDAAEESNIRFTFFNDEVPDRFFLPEVMGGGAAWIDFDLDQKLDLLLVNGSELRPNVAPSPDHPHAMFQNLGSGKFRPIVNSGLAYPGYGQGCAVGDFDVDGFPDMYITYYGQDRLFHNQGDGTFEEVTAAAGITENYWGSGVAWLDLDGDENLDLYVVNYLDVTFANHRVCHYDNHGSGYCGPGDFEGVQDRVYRSLGNGSFADVTEEYGFIAQDARGLGIVVADFNDDLLAEIYIANDMAANFMFTRTGDLSGKLYHDIAFDHGSAVSESGLNEASMGVACSDFDNDGRPDIFLTHFFGQKNTLYRNLDKLFFLDDSRRTRIAATSFHVLGFGTCALDYDRDGANDLLITNGHVLGKNHLPNEMESQVLRNEGGRFWDISEHAGPYFREKVLGRALAAADYDDDGDLDAAITHIHRPTALLRNDTQAGKHYLGLMLKSESRIPPVGGRVIVRSGNRTQTIPVVAGGSYYSSPDPRLLLGVEGPKADVAIHWPSGRVDQFPGLEVDKYWIIEERVEATRLSPATP